MITRHIDIDNNKWGILLCFDFDVDYDENDLVSIMRSFKMRERNIDKSLNILSTYNSGMTISNDDLRMSAMFIGRATSKGQFLNTIVHETAHTASAITTFYNKPCSGEDFAYLSGFIFQRIMEEIADIR